MLGATVAGVTLLRLLSVLYDVTLRKGISVCAAIYPFLDSDVHLQLKKFGAGKGSWAGE